MAMSTKSVPDLATLHRQIVAVVLTVDVAMLQHVWMELEYRLNILRANRGAFGWRRFGFYDALNTSGH